MADSPLALNSLERAVMEMLLAGNHPVLRILADQLSKASITSRELTGVGFFTRFSVPETAARVVNPASFLIDDVSADLDGLEHGAGFVLWGKEGVLACLEGFSYAEPWPQSVDGFQPYYLKTVSDEKNDVGEIIGHRYQRSDDRDFAALTKKLSPRRE